MQVVTDSLGRRSRMRATSTGKRIRLTDRDVEWLQFIHRHGPLASSHLLRSTRSHRRSEKRARERLGDLFHEANTAHGGPYLTRPHQQFHTIDSRYNQLVYNLAPAGIEAIRQLDLWSNHSGPSGGPWWHSFMVSSITGSIELDCHDRDDLRFISQAQILERAGLPLSFPVKYRHPSSKQIIECELRPDAMFGLEYLTDRGSRFRFFVVEADRSTEPLTSRSRVRKSILSSMLQYQYLLRDGVYRERFKLTAPLIVLFVCSSQPRAERMAEIALANYPLIAPAMLFGVRSEFGEMKLIPRYTFGQSDQQWIAAGGGRMRIDLP